VLLEFPILATSSASTSVVENGVHLLNGVICSVKRDTFVKGKDPVKEQLVKLG